jgi:NAD(P)-dependent dehydrogenase (short-subunit alcohol dehydrogenase family)
LAAEGARLLLVGRSGEALAEAASDCRAAGGEAEILQLDVTTDGAATRMVQLVEEAFGPVELLVWSAGTNWARPLTELSSEDFERHWKLHVLAPFTCFQAAVPGMAERGFGRVVTVASIASKRPSLFNLAYAVVKAGQLSLTRGFADAFARQGVTVNSILPGPIDTEMWAGVLRQTAIDRGVPLPDVIAQAEASTQRGEFGTPDEVGAVIAFLCSSHAANVTGAAYTCDGGSVQALY